MKVTLSSAVIALGAAGLLNSQPSFGQRVAESSAVLEEVVVTATKRVERLQDVPMSIATESGAELEHRGATSLEDIIANTPSLNNPGSGGGNSTNLTIRGVTTGTDLGNKQSTVSPLYDDIPVDPVGQFGGATNLRPVDVERVEVLRGPQGTLFGSGSLAGAVRYITNKPDLRQFSATAEITAASTDHGANSYSGNLIVNAPLVEGKYAARVVAYDYYDAGWINNLYTGKNNENSTRTQGGRLELAANPNERFSAELTIFYQDSKDFNGIGGSLYTTPPGQSGPVSDGISDQTDGLQNTIYALALKYDFDSATLYSNSSYHHRNDQVPAYDTFFVPLVSLIATGGANIIPGLDRSLYAVDEHNYTQELRLSSRGDGAWKWTIGTFYLQSDAFGKQEIESSALIPVIGGGNIVDFHFTQIQKELSGFAEMTYTVAKKWDFTGGVRVSKVDVTSSESAGGYLPVGSESPAAYAHANFGVSGSPVSPRVSIAYRPNPDVTLYAEAARGYRVGGLNLTSVATGAPSTYGSDSLWNYEVGAKGNIFDTKAIYRAAVYYIDWRNIQIGLQNAIANWVGNAGNAGLYGVEFQLDSKLISWLAFGGGFALSSNTISQGNPNITRPTGVVGVNRGDLLPASPEAQATGYAEVDFSAMSHSAYVRLGARYLGPEWTDFAHTGTKFGDFTSLNIRAGVHFDRFEFVAFVDNLSNIDGKVGALDPQFAGPVVLQNLDAFRIRPRTVGLTIRAKF
jgi:outer membrane receptor protein involved in Fe transport